MRNAAETDRLFRRVLNAADQRGVDIRQFQDRHRFRYHDTGHFQRAALLAGHIAVSTPGADFVGAVLGAALHDIGRVRDEADPWHGVRGTVLVAQNRLLDPWLGRLVDPDVILFAIQYHPEGRVTDNATVGAVWDADRLDLRRLGELPDPAMLSTVEGKRLARLIARRSG